RQVSHKRHPHHTPLLPPTTPFRSDSPHNPADPTASPSDTRTDDEMYNLLKLLGGKTNKVLVDTSNPSDDDNVFFAWFEVSAKGRSEEHTSELQSREHLVCRLLLEN